jgi:hypothetical protein
VPVYIWYGYMVEWCSSSTVREYLGRYILCGLLYRVRKHSSIVWTEASVCRL